MRLTLKQKEFLLKIYVPFLSLTWDDVDQIKGGGSPNDKCGKCFGWWLAYLHGVHLLNLYNRYRFEDGIDIFNHEMGLKFSKHTNYTPISEDPKTIEFAYFMNSCGSVNIKTRDLSRHPFDGSDWKLQPHQVIRNMLEKGD